MRVLTALLFLLATTLASADTNITYQGQLQDGAGPHSGSVDMVFELFDAETGGSSVGSAVSAGNVAVQDGLFQVELDFGDQPYESGLYLEIEVDGETLSPRQPITAAPLAVRTLSGGGGGANWSVSGDDIYFDDGNVAIGTDDAAGHRLRVVSAFASGDSDNNASGFFSAIAGGQSNTASGSRSAIAGGRNNEVSGQNSFIGGGDGNEASGMDSAVVGGGGTTGGAGALGNTASGTGSVVVGGWLNTASGDPSFVGGGTNGTAGGQNSFIAGGSNNTASGNHSAIAE